MGGIVVKPRARIYHGHDWVFSGEVLKVFGQPEDGAVISLKDGRDRLLGSAIYNSKSQIVARRFSRRKQDLDLAPHGQSRQRTEEKVVKGIVEATLHTTPPDSTLIGAPARWPGNSE